MMYSRRYFSSVLLKVVALLEVIVFVTCDVLPTIDGDDLAPGWPLVGCSANPADVVFVVDTSNSIWGRDFKKQLQFVKDVIDLFPIDSGHIQVGLVTYADIPRLHFHLGQYGRKSDVQRAVSRIRHVGGYGTHTAEALRFLRDVGFQFPVSPNRYNVTRIGIVVTDGQSDNQEHTQAEAELTREQGIHLFAVGVGSHRHLGELQAIASHPKQDYTIVADNQSGRDRIRNLLAIKECAVNKPKTVTTRTTVTAPTTPTTTTKAGATYSTTREGQRNTVPLRGRTVYETPNSGTTTINTSFKNPTTVTTATTTTTSPTTTTTTTTATRAAYSTTNDGSRKTVSPVAGSAYVTSNFRTLEPMLNGPALTVPSSKAQTLAMLTSIRFASSMDRGDVSTTTVKSRPTRRRRFTRPSVQFVTGKQDQNLGHLLEPEPTLYVLRTAKETPLTTNQGQDGGRTDDGRSEDERRSGKGQTGDERRSGNSQTDDEKRSGNGQTDVGGSDDDRKSGNGQTGVGGSDDERRSGNGLTGVGGSDDERRSGNGQTGVGGSDEEKRSGNAQTGLGGSDDERRSGNGQTGDDRRSGNGQTGDGRRSGNGQTGDDRRSGNGQTGDDRRSGNGQTGDERRPGNGQTGVGGSDEEKRSGNGQTGLGGSDDERRSGNGLTGVGGSDDERRSGNGQTGDDRRSGNGQTGDDRRSGNGQTGVGGSDDERRSGNGQTGVGGSDDERRSGNGLTGDDGRSGNGQTGDDRRSGNVLTGVGGSDNERRSGNGQTGEDRRSGNGQTGVGGSDDERRSGNGQTDDRGSEDKRGPGSDSRDRILGNNDDGRSRDVSGDGIPGDSHRIGDGRSRTDSKIETSGRDGATEEDKMSRNDLEKSNVLHKRPMLLKIDLNGRWTQISEDDFKVDDENAIPQVTNGSRVTIEGNELWSNELGGNKSKVGVVIKGSMFIGRWMDLDRRIWLGYAVVDTVGKAGNGIDATRNPLNVVPGSGNSRQGREKGPNAPGNSVVVVPDVGNSHQGRDKGPNAPGNSIGVVPDFGGSRQERDKGPNAPGNSIGVVPDFGNSHQGRDKDPNAPGNSVGVVPDFGESRQERYKGPNGSENPGEDGSDGFWVINEAGQLTWYRYTRPGMYESEKKSEVSPRKNRKTTVDVEDASGAKASTSPMNRDVIPINHMKKGCRTRRPTDVAFVLDHKSRHPEFVQDFWILSRAIIAELGAENEDLVSFEFVHKCHGSACSDQHRYSVKADALRAIDETLLATRSTSSQLINRMMNSLKANEPRRRHKVGIYMTDSGSDDFKETIVAADKAKSGHGVEMFAVGFGGDASPTELQAVASCPADQHFFRSDKPLNAHTAKALARKISRNICPARNKARKLL